MSKTSINGYQIGKDPIIDKYLNLSRHSQAENEMPMFSETLLRISFKQVFGQFRRFDQNELTMYRKLLLYYYAEEYPDVFALLQIMNCYNEEDMNEIIGESEVVMEKWRNFVDNHLVEYAMLETFTHLITEWSRRNMILYGKVDEKELINKGEEFRELLEWSKKYKDKCMRKLHSKLINPLIDMRIKVESITEHDLENGKLIQDLMPKLCPLLIDRLWNATTQTTNMEESDCKRLRLEKVEVLENVMVNGRVNPTITEVFNVEESKDETEEESEPQPQEQSIEKLENALEHISDSDSEIIELFEVDSSGDEFEKDTEESSNSKTENVSVKYDLGEISVELIDDESNIPTEDESIDLPTALKYISEVHTYALLHDRFEAGELLQQVTHLLQNKN